MADLTPAAGRSPATSLEDDSIASRREPFVHGDERPSLQRYRSIVRKHRALIITFLAGTLLAAGLTLFLIPSTYTAETTLLIERNTPQVLDFREVLAESRGMEPYDFYKTQYEILKSRTLAARVIHEHGLETERLFTGRGGEEGPLRKGLSVLRGYATTVEGWLRHRRPSPPSPTEEDDPLGIDPALIDRYLGMLDIRPTQKTQLVRIVFHTPDPRLSARLANAHARVYIQQGLERRAQANEEAQGFLAEKLGELKARVEQSEAALNQYRQVKGIISLDDKENVVVERLGDLNRRLTEAEADRIDLESQMHLIRKRRYESLPAVINSGLIQTLTAEAVRLEGEYAHLATLFKPGYGRLDQLRAQMENARRRLMEEIRRVVDGIESGYLAAVAKEKQLQAAMDEQKAAALRFKGASVHYAILAREVDTNRQLYESVLQRMKETGVAAELRSSNVTVIDRAAPPRRPSHPKVKQSLLLAALLGLMGGIGVAFTREHFDDTVNSPEELQRYLHLPNLGMVPDFMSLQWRRSTPQTFPSATSRIPHYLPAVTGRRTALSHHPLLVVIEAYRTLRTAILLSRAEKPPQTLLFTSAMHGEGKTATVVNTAIVLAQTGATVLVIDADLRRPQCHKLLGSSGGTGLTEILTGLRAPEDSVQRTYVAELSFINSGTTPPNPADLLGSRKMRETLARFREHYDYILLDTPPVLPVSDALLLSTMADGVVLVVGAQKTPKRLVKEACARLDYARANILGTTLNRVDLHDSNYAPYYWPYTSLDDDAAQPVVPTQGPERR